MDSITQAALGAAVAQAGWGRTLGRNAMLWGLLWGTFPDLDILTFPWLDDSERLGWHRGLSHSLLMMLVLSPVLAEIMHRLYREKCPRAGSTWTVFWILFTHVLIDCFTVYGTQIFEPFSNERVGFNNLFIIDPLFTLPLLGGLAGAWYGKDEHIRRKANFWGLVFASLYVGWSFFAKDVANRHFRSEMVQRGITVDRLMTHPAPFNTIQWRLLAEDEKGYWIAYHSLLRRSQPVTFRYVAREEERLDNMKQHQAVRRLIWFSQGYFNVREVDEVLIFSDLRFGEYEDPSGHVMGRFKWQVVRVDKTEETHDGTRIIKLPHR
ncbi:MAG: metal-dependent hydrolase [Candidatus Methylacidiphilales bacterium]